MDTSGTGTRVTAPPPPPQEQPLGESDPQCYVVTAHRPSAVLASVVCAFTSPEDLNLIISKVTRMEIHRVRQDGLEGIADVPIYGRVAALKVRNLFQPSSLGHPLFGPGPGPCITTQRLHPAQAPACISTSLSLSISLSLYSLPICTLLSASAGSAPRRPQDSSAAHRH